MTRERAAKLLRTWRRASRRTHPLYSIKRVRAETTRAYLVQHVGTGERGGLYVCAEENASALNPYVSLAVTTAGAAPVQQMAYA